MEKSFDNLCWEPGEIANRPYLLLGAQTGQQGVERGNVLAKSHLPPCQGVFIYWEQIKKKKGNRRFKDLESITSYFQTCRGTGRAAQQDGSDGGG